MCSLWVDGLHGVAHHLVRHAGFAVVAKAPLPKLLAWARGDHAEAAGAGASAC